MSCDEFREKVMDMARGRDDAAVLDHVRECEECQRALLNQRTLSAGLRSISTNETAAPSPALEAQLLARFDVVRGPRFKIPRWTIPALAGAAALVAAWIFLAPRQPLEGPLTGSPKAPSPMVAVHPPLQVSSPAPKAARRRARIIKATRATPAPETEAPFIPIPYATPLDPSERVEIVRVNLSATGLASLGLRVWGAQPDMRVNAELILGENGLARAVRLVQ
jgi:hypothetical protein